MVKHVAVGPDATRQVIFGNDLPLVLIAGPCQMESRAHALECAQALKDMAAQAGIGLIYKSSFDKANRTSLSGKRGIGIDEGLAMLATDISVMATKIIPPTAAKPRDR